MLFWTIVRVALKSLRANKLRSLLAMLGIIIGVWSVISALALAEGVKQSITNTMSSLGTNLLTITPGLNRRGAVRNTNQQTLKVGDATALVGLAGVARVTPVVRGNGQARFFNKNASTSLSGVAPTYCAIHDFKVARGRPITDGDCDASARVCLLGPTTAEHLFGTDFLWGVGQDVGVNGVAYRVIGILASKGDQGWFNPDDQILIPYTTAMTQVIGQTYLNEVDVSATDESKLDAVLTRATLLLRRRHRLGRDKDNDFNVRNQTEVLKSAGDIQFFLSALLGGIAAISLLVGGIGVMNVMLVTVAERTREIGIRKAIGARRRDILRQFLIESCVMSGVGGVIGVAAAFVTSTATNAVQSRFALLVTPLSVVLAVVFSCAVGVFFGYYPARRAAGLDPIEALRYE